MVYDDGMNEHGVRWEHFNHARREMEPNEILPFNQQQYANPVIPPPPPVGIASPSTGTNTLGTNQNIKKGQSITSSDGSTVLTLHPDGNLILTGHRQVLWTSGTKGQHVDNAGMYADGNFNVNDGGSTLFWSNGASGHKDAHLIVNNDGSMTVWDGSNHQIWDSGTQNFTVNPTPGGGGAQHKQFGGLHFGPG
jgi:hypothetical protein